MPRFAQGGPVKDDGTTPVQSRGFDPCSTDCLRAHDLAKSVIAMIMLAFIFSYYCINDALGANQSAPRVALVIGNSEYGPSLGRLANPVNDAQLISIALESVGFRVTTLLNADQRGMKRAISDFGAAVSEAGPETVALFFFAGHGIQFDGASYLIPSGAVVERNGDVDLEAIDAASVLRQLEYAGGAISIVVLDACRNNPLPRSVRSSAPGLSRLEAPIGSFVAYSTAPGETAVDGEAGNSPFATALAEEILRPGAMIEEVFRNVRRRVIEATNGQQVPWDSSSLTAPFVFVPSTIATPVPSMAARELAIVEL